MTFFDDDQTTEALDDVVEGESEVFEEPSGASFAPIPAAVASAMDARRGGNGVFRLGRGSGRRSGRSAKEATAVAPKRGAFVLDEAAREAVTRFLWHFGPSTPISELSPKTMEGFQETIGTNTMDLAARFAAGEGVPALLLEAGLHGHGGHRG